MKLVTFEAPSPLGPLERLGALRETRVIDLNLAARLMYDHQGLGRAQERANFFVPPTLLELLDGGEESMAEARKVLAWAKTNVKGAQGERLSWSQSEIVIKSPLPRPRSLRDFFAFEGHAKAGAARRNETIAPEWYQQPVFYKGNARSIIGPNEEIPWPSFTRKLDFEFEIAAVIGTAGRDIPVSQALKYVGGYCVMNDCSARDIQKNEMVCRMGPAKGKDFATVLGPWLVTADEWDGSIPELTTRVNGREWSRSKGVQPYWNFATMISHASQGETLLPGDIIGSGTYFTGCGLDLDRWIAPGDLIELDAGPLGILKNIVGTPTGQTHLRYDKDGAAV